MTPTILLQSIGRILHPIVRICIRHGLTADTVTDIVRRLFVDVALKEFAIEGKAQTLARVSVLTGIHRKEVSRLAKQDLDEDADWPLEWNRAAQVLGAWLRDETYRDDHGDPLGLPFSGEGASFTQLVEAHSGDMKPRAVLNELLRVGAVEQSEGQYRMTARGYVPADEPDNVIKILGADTAELIETIDHNLRAGKGDRLYQRKVLFERIPTRFVGPFRELSARLAQQTLEQLDAWLAERESRQCGEATATLGLGAFQIERFDKTEGGSNE